MIEPIAASPKVAYQGAPGANGERAILAYWKDAACPVPMASFTAVAAGVADGTVAFGLIPVWNSTIGPIDEGQEAVRSATKWLEQLATVTVAVQHALLALPGVTMHDLRAIGSHPAALAQCQRLFSENPHLVPVAAWDTAGAATELAEFARIRGAAGTAAPALAAAPWYSALPEAVPERLGVIASSEVASRIGLAVVAGSVQDDLRNRTCFAVLRGRRSW